MMLVVTLPKYSSIVGRAHEKTTNQNQTVLG